MISKAALTEFWERSLKDSSRAKRFTDEVLDKKLRKLDVETVTEPRFAQKVSLLLGLKYASYGFLLGTGGGKTKLVLDLFKFGS